MFLNLPLKTYAIGYGPVGLALLENGATAEQALQILLQNDPQREIRQVGIVDFKGNAATSLSARFPLVSSNVFAIASTVL